MKFLSLFFFSITFYTATFSQTTISGEVLDSLESTPIEFSSIRLFSVADSSVVQGVYSDEKGRFSLEKVIPGNYFIKVSFSGYQTKSIPSISITGQPIYALGKIGLSMGDLQKIEEVTVTADIDVLKAGIDKKVYNVDQDLSTRGGSANDILNNIPSVDVDQDGNVSLRGEGNVTILIDGRPSSLTGANFLDAIPASSIERVEVVTNPSAKYDPDGTSGIINVVLKKNKLQGFNGQISSTIATGHDHNFNGALSYRNSILNVYGSYAFDYERGYRNNIGYIEQNFTNDSISRLEQDRAGTDFDNGHNARLGADFYLNSQNTLGISVVGQKGFRRRTGAQLNQQFDGDGILVSEWNRLSKDPVFTQGMDANLNFSHILKKEKGKWSLDFNQSLSNENENGEYEQSYSLLNGVYGTQNATSQRLYSETFNSIFTGQFDLEYIISKMSARIETGAKTILRNQQLAANSESYDADFGNFQTDNLANYDYSYDENISSVYGIFGQQIGKFKYQLGVRGEYAFQNPVLTNDTSNYAKEYFNFFPSGHLRYKTSKKSELSLSYSRRINRPSAGQLNPFTNYSDPYNLRRGNPDLSPEFIHSLDLGYSWDAKRMNLSASVFYRNTIGVIQRVKLFYPDNTSAGTFENIDESNSGGIEFVALLKPTKWWRNTLSWNGNYVEFTNSSTTSNWNNSGFNWSLKYSSSVEFWKKSATIQLNVNYSAPRITAQGRVTPWRFVDVSFEKLLLDKKLAIGVRLGDVFNTKGFLFYLDQPSVTQESEFKWLTRRLYFTISYKFGKLEMSKKGNGGGGEGMDF